MRARLPRLALLALGASIAGAAHAAADALETSGAMQVLEECAHQRQPGAAGLDELQSLCPGLEQALIALGLSEQLEDGWRSRISTAAVEDLLRLARRYAADPPSTGPNIATLSDSMQALQEPSAPQSWWQRFKAWLRSWLQQPGEQDTSWLKRLLPTFKLSPALARAIGFSLIALVIGFALWIVWREIKLARTGPAPRQRAARGARRRVPAPAEAGSEALDLSALPAWQRPAAVLDALVRTLRRGGRLSLERALTHRQLGARARFDDDSQRARFLRLSLLAERQLYDAQSRRSADPSDAELAQAVSDGLALQAQLRPLSAERS